MSSGSKKQRAARSLVLGVCVIGCADRGAHEEAGESAAAASLAAAVEIEDYLVQDVCVSVSNAALVVSDDPAACRPGYQRRNLYPAESLPYHKTDAGGYQLSDSFALRSFDISKLLYVSTMDFNSFLESNPQAQGIDGWNIAEANGSYVSLVGTQDGSGPYQDFIGPGCRTDDAWTPDDAWVLFPNAAPSGVSGSGVFPMFIRRENVQTCTPRPSKARVGVTWEGPFPFTYTSGRTLTTVKSYHQVTDAKGNAAWEIFYFTKEYGLTRWEAWTTSGAANPGIACNGGIVAGNLNRGDCRDWTRIVPDPTFWSNGVSSGGGYSPYAYNVTRRFVETNRLRNGDFGGIDGVIPYWQRYYGSNGAITDWAVATHVLANWDTYGANGPQAQNHNLVVSCRGECTGNVVFQDVAELPSYTTWIEYGVTLWSDAPTRATIALFTFDAAGKMLAHENVAVSLDAARNSFRRGLSTPRGTTRFRFAVYPSTGPGFHMDDAWAVPK